MTIDLTGDIDRALGGPTGETITVDGVDYDALVDAVDVFQLAEHGAPVAIPRLRVTVRTDAIPGLTQDTELTVRGDNYRVDQIDRADDGYVTQFMLASA